ncbi:Hypothetical protein A7982_04546 [Minicystis rosea]|nr:Hypothetical protein A7982_04546 [Minicystis rosea]
MNRTTLPALFPVAVLSLLVAGCPAEPAAGRGATASTSVTAPSSAPAAATKPMGIVRDRNWELPVVAGTSCDGHKSVVSPSDAKLTKDPATGRWLTQNQWGCGCPSAPVFTMVYEPKTAPLKVRLCIDPENDKCEAVCSGPVVWNLDAPLREAGTTEVQLVK